MSSVRDQLTCWPAVWALFFAGSSAALHVGKLPAALPLLQVEFSLSLTETGVLVSVYSLMIMLLALILGASVSTVGYLRTAILGVSLGALGSLIGIQASMVTLFLFSRIVEGLGWILCVVAFPSMMSSLASSNDKPVVMGIWGAFMPIGSGSMLFIAPELQAIGGWRLVWVVSSVLSVIAVLLVLIVGTKMKRQFADLETNQHRLRFADSRNLSAWALSGCFFFYSFIYISITMFLPKLLVETSALTITAAAKWGSLIMLSNAIGNVFSGMLIRMGFQRSHLLIFGALSMGCFAACALVIPNTELRIVCALLMSAFGGVIPGTLFATAPLVAVNAAATGIVIGIFFTGTGAGQVLGPIAITRVVELVGDWRAGGLLLLFAGIAGALSAKAARL